MEKLPAGVERPIVSNCREKYRPLFYLRYGRDSTVRADDFQLAPYYPASLAWLVLDDSHFAMGGAWGRDRAPVVIH